MTLRMDDGTAAKIGRLAAGAAPPTPPRVGALSTIGRCRKELASLYRDARQGHISAQQAAKLAYLLNILAGMIESQEVEARLEKLERRAIGHE